MPTLHVLELLPAIPDAAAGEILTTACLEELLTAVPEASAGEMLTTACLGAADCCS
jgi:hypothetical protein